MQVESIASASSSASPASASPISIDPNECLSTPPFIVASEPFDTAIPCVSTGSNSGTDNDYNDDGIDCMNDNLKYISEPLEVSFAELDPESEARFERELASLPIDMRELTRAHYMKQIEAEKIKRLKQSERDPVEQEGSYTGIDSPNLSQSTERVNKCAATSHRPGPSPTPLKSMSYSRPSSAVEAL